MSEPGAVKRIVSWWWGPVLAFALIGAMRLFVPLPFVNEVLIFSIYTIGCSFLLGRVGFISFGQPAYLAVGAYATSFYLYYFGANPYVALLIGVGAGLVAAAAVGPFFVRLRSDYFALVNLALAVIVFYLAQKVLVEYTKGDNGLWFLANIASTPVLDISAPKGFFVFALVVAFLVWAFYKYLDDTVFGAACLATKINEEKLMFLGYSNFRIRLLAFMIANTTTALAGGMYAIYLGGVTPEMSSPSRAADPVVVAILGGAGTLYGPIVGALAYTGLKDVVSRVIGNWEVFIGFVLVFIMLAGEKGIWGTLSPWLAKRLRRRAPGGAAPPTPSKDGAP